VRQRNQMVERSLDNGSSDVLNRAEPGHHLADATGSTAAAADTVVRMVFQQCAPRPGAGAEAATAYPGLWQRHSAVPHIAGGAIGRAQFACLRYMRLEYTPPMTAKAYL